MRLIDGDELLKKQHDVVLKNGAKHRCICREDIDEAPTIEPNLVINPDEVKRGDVTMIGAEIVVMHYDDYMEMMLKSGAVDDGSWERFATEPCEDAISREDAIKAMEYPFITSLNECERRQMIADIPSVAPSRPSGEWITEEKESIYGKKIRLTCSECGDVFDVTETAFPYERYCRYCGAKMVKGRE